MNADLLWPDLKDLSTYPGRRTESWRWSDLSRALRVVPEPSRAIGSEVASDLCHLGEGIFTRKDLSNFSGALSVRLKDQDGLHLHFQSDGQGRHEGQITIEVPAGAHAVLLETVQGQGTYAASVQTKIVVEAGARLDRLIILDDGDDAIGLYQGQVDLAPAASFSQTLLTTGGRLTRHETHVRHQGDQAHVRLDGVYILNGQAHADLTTCLDHIKGHGTADQLCKGVVKDQARGVFQGKIIVREGADGTDARMGHHALILNDGAEIDAKPELEIYADEVTCAHGNTIGALDENAIFYLMSRGLPQSDAKALLMRAYVLEILDRLEHEGLRERALVWLESRLLAEAR